MHKTIKALKRGFTLYELMIVCAMLVIISGIVVSLVVFMNSYSKNVETNSDYTEGLVELRENIDYWFSKMDSSSYTITTVAPETTDINGTDVTLWAYYKDGGDLKYYIGSYQNDDGTMYLFCSEDGVYHPVQVPFLCEICVTDYSAYTYSQNDNVRLQFSINMPVTDKIYLCEVIYDGD